LIDPALKLPVSDQCRLLDIPRSTFNFSGSGESEENLSLMEVIDKLYLAHPENGSRKMVRVLARQGIAVNRTRVQRLMQLMGIRSLTPQRRTTIAHPDHAKYPYLVRGVDVNRPNQVWASDITCLPFHKGFMYLVAIMVRILRVFVHAFSLNPYIHSRVFVHPVGGRRRRCCEVKAPTTLL
jgi:putative transposase